MKNKKRTTCIAPNNDAGNVIAGLSVLPMPLYRNRPVFSCYKSAISISEVKLQNKLSTARRFYPLSMPLHKTKLILIKDKSPKQTYNINYWANDNLLFNQVDNTCFAFFTALYWRSSQTLGTRTKIKKCS